MIKIICPTDFSETSKNAILYAGNLSRELKAELTLFHVQSFDYLTADDEKYKAEAIEVVRTHLEKLALDVGQSFQIKCFADVQPTQQNLTTAISRTAPQYELIVMGTDGVHNLTELFAGSHTYNVIRKTEIPLLLIPSSYSYKKPNKMVYSFNYLKERKLPITQLLPFVQNLGLELTVLDVVEEVYSDEMNKELEALQLKLSQENKNRVKMSFDSIHADNTAGSIHSYVLRNEADILALCAEDHGLIGNLFHKSVVKIVSNIADYPVFVFHH